MISEKVKVANNLEWEALEKDEQQERLTEEVRDKSIYDFLKNNDLPRQRACNYLTNGMKYITSQMLDEVNEILDKKSEELTWEDKID